MISGARDVTAVSPLAGRRPYYVTLVSEMRSGRGRAPAAPHAARRARNAFVFIVLFEIIYNVSRERHRPFI